MSGNHTELVGSLRDIASGRVMLRASNGVTVPRSLLVKAAEAIEALTHASDCDKQGETRPANCRFRLQDEGKSYPRSSCSACGKNIATGLGNRCKESPSDHTADVTEEELAAWLKNSGELILEPGWTPFARALLDAYGMWRR